MAFDNTTIVVSSAIVIGLIILLLLIIIGIVTFNAYMFVIADNGVRLGAGGDVALFTRNRGNRRQYRNFRGRNRSNQSMGSQEMQSIY